MCRVGEGGTKERGDVRDPEGNGMAEDAREATDADGDPKGSGRRLACSTRARRTPRPRACFGS